MKMYPKLKILENLEENDQILVEKNKLNKLLKQSTLYQMIINGIDAKFESPKLVSLLCNIDKNNLPFNEDQVLNIA